MLERSSTPVETRWTLTPVVLVAGAVSSGALVLLAGNLSPFSILAVGLVAGPHLFFLRQVREELPRVALVDLVVALLLLVTSIAAYRPSIVRGSSTASLIFLFLPLAQAAVVLVAMLLTKLIRWRASRP